MAVYKPTNCSPYLATFDITTDLPHYFECRVDTSNTKITAYSIVVYDEENNQVFPVDASGNPVDPIYSYVSELGAITGTTLDKKINSIGMKNLNTGLNGSYLKIPFVQDINKQLLGLKNSVYWGYNNEAEADPKTGIWAENPDGSDYVRINMQNGYSYKWVITLYQWVTENGLAPSSYYDFDMVLTTGEVMGSTNERIQSAPSENIYVDYYVQAYRVKDSEGNVYSYDANTGKIEADGNAVFEAVGNRVRIKNYDYSYGYIYPQSGSEGFPKEMFEGENKPNAFRVFSQGNDPDILSTTRKVDYVTKDGEGIPFEWTSLSSDESASYGTQTYYIDYRASYETTSKALEALADAATAGTIYPFDSVFTTPEKEGNHFYELPQKADGVWSSGDWTVIPTEHCFFIKDEGNASLVLGSSFSPGNRIILNYQKDLDKYDSAEDSNFAGNTNGSRYNGIFTIDSIATQMVRVTQGGSSPSGTGSQNQNHMKVQVRWRRTSDADTWGEIANKIVYNTATTGGYVGQNVQIQAFNDKGEPIDVENFIGTINTTPLKFIPEKPLNIYAYDGSELEANPYINNTGVIFYNKPTSADSDGLLYIRPFVGLGPNMWFQHVLPNQTGNHFLIKEVNEKFWFVTYDKVYTGRDNETTVTDTGFPIGDRYQIRTFYRIGDENPFTLSATPTLDIKIYNSLNRNSENNGEITGNTVACRSIDCEGEYTPVDGVYWRNYSWALALNGAVLSSTDVVYNGNIETTFDGLVSDNTYSIELTVELQDGRVITTTRDITVEYSSSVSTSVPFLINELCDLTASSFEFAITAYILPNPGEKAHPQAGGDTNDTDPHIDGVSYSDEALVIGGYKTDDDNNIVVVNGTEVFYSKGYPVYLGQNLTGNDILSEGDSVTIQTSITPRKWNTVEDQANNRFIGSLVEVELTDEGDDTTKRCGYAIPSDGTYNESTRTYTPNTDRNKFLAYTTNSSGSSIELILEDGGSTRIWNDGLHLILPTFLPEPVYNTLSEDGTYGGGVSFHNGISPWIEGESGYSSDYKFLLYTFSIWGENESSTSLIHPPLRDLSGEQGFETSEEQTFTVSPHTGATAADQWNTFLVTTDETKVPVLWQDKYFEVKTVVVGSKVEDTQKGLEPTEATEGLIAVTMATNLESENVWFWEDEGNIWDDGAAGVGALQVQQFNQDYSYEHDFQLPKKKFVFDSWIYNGGAAFVHNVYLKDAQEGSDEN